MPNKKDVIQLSHLGLANGTCKRCGGKTTIAWYAYKSLVLQKAMKHEMEVPKFLACTGCLALAAYR